MADEKTTISLGFKADVQELNRVGIKVNWLKRRFNLLASSVERVAEGTSKIAPISHNIGMGQVAPVTTPGHPTQPATASPKNAPVDNARVNPRRRTSILDRMGMPYGMRRVGRMGMGGAMAAGGGIGLALSVAGAAGKGVQLAKAYMDALGPLNKQLSLLNGNQQQFVGHITETAISLGVARAELLQYTKAYVGQAGAQSGRVGSQVASIGGLAKGMGMDVGATYSQMGGLAQNGAFGNLGNMRANQFAALIADAVSQGGMKGREGELLSSINSLVSVQLQTLTRPENMGGMFGIMNALNRSGQPGLRGSAGANLMNKLNQGIMNPGGGDYGEMMMYQALGGGNYFDFKMRQEEGAFGENENFLKLMRFTKNTYGNSKQRWFAMSQMLPGVSMHQAKALEGAIGSTGHRQSGFVDALKTASDGNLGSINTENYGLLADLYNAKDGAGRMKVMKDSRLSNLAGKFNANSPLEDMMKEVAKANIVTTPEDKIKSQLAEINTTLEKGGRKAIGVFSKTAEEAGKIFNFLTDTFGANKRPEGKFDPNVDPGGTSTLVDWKNPHPANVTTDGRKINVEGAYKGKDFDYDALVAATENMNKSSNDLSQAAGNLKDLKLGSNHGPAPVLQSGHGSASRD